MPTPAAPCHRPKLITRYPATGVFRPLRWLHQAWRVLLAAPAVSAGLGIGFTTLCALAYAAAAALPLFAATFATLLLAVIALPRIVDRDCDVVQAITTGLRVIRANPLIVAAWSLILLVTIALGLASQLWLMPLVFPVLAYASWFCYAELSRDRDGFTR